MAAVLYFPSLDGDGGVEDFFFFLGKRTSSSTVSAPERASDKMDPKRQDDGRFSEFCSHQISEKSNIVATARTRRVQSTYQVVVGPEMAIQNCPHVFGQSGLCRIRVIIHVRPYILYKILFTLLTRERSTAGKRLAMSSTWACRFLRSPRTSFNCHWRRKESECVIDYSVSARIVYTSLINKSKSACPASWQLEWEASSARTTKVQVVQQPIFTDDLVWTWWWGTRARWRVSYSSETVPFMLSVTTGRRCVVFTIAKQTGELLTESLLKADRRMFILTLHPVVLIHIGDSTCLPGF